jgi:hypothetical protein
VVSQGKGGNFTFYSFSNKGGRREVTIGCSRVGVKINQTKTIIEEKPFYFKFELVFKCCCPLFPGFPADVSPLYPEGLNNSLKKLLLPGKYIIRMKPVLFCCLDYGFPYGQTLGENSFFCYVTKMDVEFNSRANGACPICISIGKCRIQDRIAESVSAFSQSKEPMELVVYSCPQFLEKSEHD